ncbi:hypothetical protein A0257_22505 (plasmid) [Hymenobacter psoromatis]|nr:hypothetical protein A0257_22505 [Hymenobacter psoromatis]
MLTSEPNAGQQLLTALFAAFNTGADDVLRLFAAQAVVEFPYAASVGSVARFTRDEYHQYLTKVLPTIPHLRYGELHVYPLQAEGQYFAEMHASTTMPSTGLPYEQDYVIYCTIADGHFTHFREYWNPVTWLRASGGEQAMHSILNPQ